MAIPKAYTDFKQAQPDLVGAYETLGDACRSAGPLDAKTLALVKLGIAVGAGLEGAAHSAVRKALHAGCSADECEHAAILARDGFDRAEIRAWLFEHARIPREQWSKGGMYQMCGRVVSRSLIPQSRIHLGHKVVSDTDGSFQDLAFVQKPSFTQLPGILNDNFCGWAHQGSMVAYLSPPFRIKGRGIQEKLDFLILFGLSDDFFSLQHR